MNREEIPGLGPHFLRPFIAHAPPRKRLRKVLSLLSFFAACLIGTLAPAQEATSEPALQLEQAPSTTLPTIASMNQFWMAQQNPSVRELEHPLDLVFTVLYYDAEWNVLFVENNGVGNYVPTTGKPFAFEEGNRVRLAGTVIPTESLTPKRASVEIQKQEAMPAPLPITEQLEDAADYNTMVASIKGYVDRVSYHGGHRLAFDLVVSGRRIEYRVKLDRRQTMPQILGKFVEVEGVFIMDAGQDGKPDELVIWTHDVSGIKLVETRDSQLFELDPIPLAELASAGSDSGVKIEGVVYSQEPGKRMILRDPSGQIQIEIEQASPLEAGTTIEVVGVPVLEGASWTLRNAVYRKASKALSPEDADRAKEILHKYRLAEQVLGLPSEQLDAGHSASVSGVVTFCDPGGGFFYLQDVSGGVRVQPREPFHRLLAPGEAVEVEGEIVSGVFSPMLIADTVTPLAHLPLPQPIVLPYEQAISGHEDSQWVEMVGYVERRESDEGRTRLLLSTVHGEFAADILSPEGPLVVEEGSTVKLQGVLTAHAGADRKLEGISLLVPSPEHLQAQAAPLADPFNLPLSQISSLERYRPSSVANEHVKVSGVVIYHNPGKTIFLDDGTEVLRVVSRSEETLEPGEKIDVVGVVQRLGHRIQLRNPIFRRVGIAKQPAAKLLSHSKIGIDADLNGHLVTFSGKLLEITAYDGRARLLVQNEGIVLEAKGHHRSLRRAADLWLKGSTISVTGIYDIAYDRYAEPDKLSLLIRDRNDVTVLKPPPWWSPKRALIVAAICLAALLIAASWSTLLRQRISTQTHLIRKQVEREALLETQHREIVSNVSDFIFTLGFDGRFLSFNEAGERMTGYARHEVPELSIYNLLDERQSRRVKLALSRLRTMRNVAFETRIRKKDGSLLWVEVNGGFLRRDGEAICAYCVLHNIDARKQTEEELKKARDAAEENTRAKSAFLATMSHELRTPMNGVIGMTELLLDLDLDTCAREYAETIRDSASCLLVLLNDILDMSKAEAGKLSVEPHPFNLQETVQQPLALLEASAAAKGLQLLITPLPHSPGQLLGDAGRLRQVLLNLVGNAIKFTDQGHVTLTLSIAEETERDLLVRFDITDTGIGIPQKAQSKLFQPFMQADASHSRRFGGTGLGLNISREIVTLLRGEIGLRSDEGRGSTFWFTARFGKVAAMPLPTPGKPRAPAKAKLQWRGPAVSILIAEDTPVNQRVTRLQLAKMGFEADLANNGIEVLDAVKNKSYDVIFMDCQMPGMDGFEATQRLRQDPRYDGIYIIALTANAMAGDRERCLDAGMNDYVSKPTRPDKLFGALERYAGEAKLSDN